MESNMKLYEKIESGMQVAASKPDIMHEEASKQMHPIYEDIQRTLRVPLINLIF